MPVPVTLARWLMVCRFFTCMQGLVRQAEVVDADSSDSDEEGMGNSHSPEGGQEPHSPGGGLVLYARGVRSCHFTLVLQVWWISGFLSGVFEVVFKSVHGGPTTPFASSQASGVNGKACVYNTNLSCSSTASCYICSGTRACVLGVVERVDARYALVHHERQWSKLDSSMYVITPCRGA